MGDEISYRGGEGTEKKRETLLTIAGNEASQSVDCSENLRGQKEQMLRLIGKLV